MSLYDLNQVDIATKTRVLSLLIQNDSYFVIFCDLDAVFLSLLVQSYPLEETYDWLSDGKKTPDDLYQKQKNYYDSRNLCYWFWGELYKHEYNLPQQRLPNGPRTENLVGNILSELTVLSFLSALHTWFATCEAYLQICNIDWYLKKYRQSPQRLWKPGEENEIPKYVAGMMASLYN